MKINNTTPVPRPLQPEQSKGSAKPQPGAESPQGGPAAVTHLSATANDTSRDIDAARVNEIRNAISEGRLEINAEKIADGLIDSVRAILNANT